MKDLLAQKLLSYKKKTIEIETLETLLSSRLSYDQFARLILSFEEEGVLEMVKSKGRNHRTPSLAYSYRIQTNPLRQDFKEELMRFRLHIHSAIQLDSYFKLDHVQWKEDLPYIEKIHNYLTNIGFPTYEVPAPERSVELVGDEKWITEQQGKELLERVGLWEKMRIIPVSDPLMFAVNSSTLSNVRQYHLIVENKTTYQALLDTLPETSFSTLIYGSGNKIIKSIEQFDRQLPIPQAEHEFYYFGDIDRSGIFIWNGLNEKRKVRLYLPFYEGCLEKPPLKGKTNQRLDHQALNKFLRFFSEKEQKLLKTVLENGQYFPQEILKTRELQEIWRHHHGIQ